MDLLENVRAMGDDHAVMSDGIDRLFHSIAVALRALYREQWDSPWHRVDPRD